MGVITRCSRVSSKHLGKSIYSQKKQKSRWNSELLVGTVIYPFEQRIARLNSNLPVGTVPATVPRYSTPTTVRQNTGNLHLEPCKTIF